MAQLSARAVAKALGGDASGNSVRAPGPGHSPDDRSLSVKLTPDGSFVVHSFAGDDPIVCRDYVRDKLGQGQWQPKPKATDGGTGTEPTHPTWGKPDHLHWYRHADGQPAFAVARWEPSATRKRKEIRPVINRDGHWLWQAMPSPRPLYGLSRLLAHPGRQVLVVEGEKKAQAAQEMLPGLCIVTWSGGSEATAHTDMSPLNGRSVILCPDNDDPGRKAMLSIAARLEGATVRIIDTSDQPAKWDIGDAIEDGWDADRIIAWAKERAKPYTATNVIQLRAVPAAPVNWKSQLVYNDQGGIKPRVVSNFKLLLTHHPEVAGVYEWNEMTSRVMSARAAPWDPPAWQRHPAGDEDISQALYWLERKSMSPRPAEVRAAITSAAKENLKHPIRDYLTALTWDKTPRLISLPATHFGTDPLPIFGLFFQRWMISAVARIMVPGCKADTIIVLEGAQERMKSTLLKCLATINGIAYFTDALHDIDTRDGAMILMGVWIIEIAELNAFQRKDADAVKSWLSRSHDRYRVPWGLTAEDFPRQCVIAGTLNPSGSGYLRDPTGARRFWPIPVRKAIDIAAIEAIRDQLWAEAFHLYTAGYKGCLSEEEVVRAREITEERYEEDPWTEIIAVFLEARRECTTNQVSVAIGLRSEDFSKVTARRVNDQLRRLGWVQKVVRIDGKLDRKWFRP